MFLISSMVLGLLDQLQILWKLNLIEMLGFLTDLRLLTRFGMLVFFTNVSLMKFQVKYLALFLLFTVIDRLKLSWRGCLQKNIQLMLEFFKAPFLVLCFSYCTLITFWWCDLWYCYLCWWYYYSKCDKTSDLWQQLELASGFESDLWHTVDSGSKWLSDFSAGKTQLVLFYQSDNTDAIDVKINGSVLEEKLSFKKLGLVSLLNWIGALTYLYW